MASTPRRRSRAPIWIAAAALALAVAAALPGGGLRLEQDLARLLPDGDRHDRRAKAAMVQLMRRTYVDVGVRGDTTHDRAPSIATLGAAADQLAAALLASGTVASVRTRIAPEEVLELVSLVRAHAGVLCDDAALRAIEARLAPDAVRERLHVLARRLQEPDGIASAADAAADPLGVTDEALAPLQALTTGFRQARIEDGRLASADGRHVLVIVDPGFPATDGGRTAAYLTALEEATAALGADPRFGAIRIRHVGAHRSTLDNARQIRSDVTVTSAVGALLVLAAALAYFGHPGPALLAFAPALYGGALALALAAWLVGSLAALVAGFGAVLVGITIDYAVHVLVRLGPEAEASARPTRAVLLGAATTSGAFFTLRLSEVPGIRDLGLFGAIGIPAAALFAVYVLPVLPWSAPRARRPWIDAEGWARRLSASRMGWVATALVVVATPVLVVGAARLRFEGDVTRLSSLSPESRADEGAIVSTWGDAFRASQVVVAGASREETLQQVEALARALDASAAEGAIRDHGAISAVLPSSATQRERAARWQAFWSDERIADARAALRAGSVGTPFRPDAFEPFLASVRERAAAIPADALGGPLAAFSDRLVETGDGSWIALTPVFTDRWDQVEALDARLNREVPEATLLNRELAVRSLQGRVQDELSTLGLGAFACVSVLVLLWYGSVVLALVLLVPLVTSCVWTLGLLGWLGIPITLANAIFVAFLLGLAIDYAIFAVECRLARFRTGEDRVAATDAAIAFCALTTCAAFGALLLAGHPVLSSIGATAVTGIAAALLVTLTLVPALLGGVLVRPSTGGGAPGLWNLTAAVWVLWVLAGRALWFLAVARWLVPRARRAALARQHASRMGQRIHAATPLGRRAQVGADAAHLCTPGVIVANHGSIYDIAALLALPVPVVMLVKGWVWRTPVMGSFVRAAGYILAEGSEPAEVVEQARAAIAAGASVIVFPEGTKSRTGQIARFRLGAFAIARALGVQVTPIAIAGSHQVGPPDGWWVGEHDACTEVLAPLDPHDFPGEGGNRQMARAARDAIRDACERHQEAARERDGWVAAIAARYRYLGWRLDAAVARELARDPLIRRAPVLCPQAERVLVTGVGRGACVARLALAFPERTFVGVDADPHAIAVASAALRDMPNARFVAGGLAERGDLGPEAFEAAIVLADDHGAAGPETDEATVRTIVGALGPTGAVMVRAPRAASTRWQTLLAHAGLRVQAAPELLSDGTSLVRAEKTSHEPCDGEADRGPEGPPDRDAQPGGG